MDETTQMPPKVAAAISAVMGQIGTLAKDDRNKHGGYDFAGIDKFLATVGPLCAEHGLIILMDETECETLETAGADGKTITWLRLGYDFTLAHSSGEVWDKKLHRNAMVNAKMGAQAFGAAQSYALKQFMRSLFQIPTGDGEDSDNHEQSQLPRTVAPASKPLAPETLPEQYTEDPEIFFARKDLKIPVHCRSNGEFLWGRWVGCFKERLEQTATIEAQRELEEHNATPTVSLRAFNAEWADKLEEAMAQRRAHHAQKPLEGK